MFELLAKDIEDNVGIDFAQALELVEFLYDNDFIDYDTLKEIYDDED